jgi:hypothetical protein
MKSQNTAMEFTGIQENFERTQGGHTLQATYEHNVGGEESCPCAYLSTFVTKTYGGLDV